MCKCNIKLIYLNFMHCTCKFEKHKQSFLSESYEQTFASKKHKQSNMTTGALIKAGRPETSGARACYVDR